VHRQLVGVDIENVGTLPAAVDWMTTLSMRAKLIDSIRTSYCDCDLLNPSMMPSSAAERGSDPWVARKVQNFSTVGAATTAVLESMAPVARERAKSPLLEINIVFLPFLALFLPIL
jgi:hypothetical protein